MMAEAVAADKRPGDSDTDSENEITSDDFGVPGTVDWLLKSIIGFLYTLQTFNLCGSSQLLCLNSF